MQITITGRQLDFGDALRAHIETGPQGLPGGQAVMLRDHFDDLDRNGGGLVRGARNPESTG